ncbi:MAG: hypothetical protein KAI66_15610 [Lentisphaeria bacterium]|nr:hypothetical protein [Lentisphaeria bacterium]
MTKLNAARERTDSKLRYAAIYLDELKVKGGIGRGDGSDWERAHQESFLYHILGVKDGLLQEINLFHQCELVPRHVRKQDLVDRLRKMGIRSHSLSVLVRLERLQSSWISIAGRMRHLFTHQKGVPRKFHVGGEEDGHVHLRDPRIDDLKHNLEKAGTPELLESTLAQPEWRAIRAASETDCLELFSQWHAEAVKLVENLRSKMPGAEND